MDGIDFRASTCLDYNNGILEWNGDYFKQATICWQNKESEKVNN